MLLRIASLALFSFVLASGQSIFYPGNAQPPPPQPPRPSGKRYKVTGTVVNAITGEPIAKAVVSGPGVRAFTDTAGNFEALDVPEGQTFFTAQRPGFFPEGARAGAGSYRPTKPVIITSSNTTVKLKLVPGGVIHGRIANSDGEPLEGIQVQISSQIMMNGLKRWQPTGSTATDETGAFTFEDQAPGSYILHTQPSRLYLQSADLEINGEHLPELYPPSYFPNAPDRDSAQPITLTAGAQAEADFMLTAVPGYSISGTVDGAGRAFVHCESTGGEMLSMSGMNNNGRNGQFTITGVPSGPCKLVARSGLGMGTNMNSGAGFVGEQEVRVASADITGIRIHLGESIPDIPITVSGQPAGATGPGVTLSILPRSATSFQRMNTFVSMKQGEGGAMEQIIHNPSPGSYRLSAMPHGNVCVASMMAGGTDLMKEDLVITRDAPTPGIVVTLRSDCGSLTGHIEGLESGVGAYVIVLGGSQPSQQMFAPAGNLTLNNLSPGEYTLYAFDDVSNIEYGNPEAMKGFTSQQVSVAAGDKANVQLKLIKTVSP